MRPLQRELRVSSGYAAIFSLRINLKRKSQAFNMNETTFLSGRVLKRSLPVVQPGSDKGTSVKRLLLPQGELAQFYDGEEPMRYLAYIELRAGAVRGNHYHKIKEEWIYMIQGEAALVIENVESKTRETTPLQAGDLAIIPPGIAHAI